MNKRSIRTNYHTPGNARCILEVASVYGRLRHLYDVFSLNVPM